MAESILPDPALFGTFSVKFLLRVTPTGMKGDIQERVIKPVVKQMLMELFARVYLTAIEKHPAIRTLCIEFLCPDMGQSEVSHVDLREGEMALEGMGASILYAEKVIDGYNDFHAILEYHAYPEKRGFSCEYE